MKEIEGSQMHGQIRELLCGRVPWEEGPPFSVEGIGSGKEWTIQPYSHLKGLHKGVCPIPHAFISAM